MWRIEAHRKRYARLRQSTFVMTRFQVPNGVCWLRRQCQTPLAVMPPSEPLLARGTFGSWRHLYGPAGSSFSVLLIGIRTIVNAESKEITSSAILSGSVAICRHKTRTALGGGCAFVGTRDSLSISAAAASHRLVRTLASRTLEGRTHLRRRNVGRLR